MAEGGRESRLELDLHCYSPTRMELPITTPEATETTPRDDNICARATPCLTGASTVLFPLSSVLVKVTTVPSGTRFPEQSRTGPVSREIPPAVRVALTLRLQ